MTVIFVAYIFLGLHRKQRHANIRQHNTLHGPNDIRIKLD